MQEAVSGIVHAAPRCVCPVSRFRSGTDILLATARTELKELHILREMLMAKYGRDFAVLCMDNPDDYVSKRVGRDLSPPTVPAVR